MICKVRYDTSHYLAYPQYKRLSKRKRRTGGRLNNAEEIIDSEIQLIEIPCKVEDLPFGLSEFEEYCLKTQEECRQRNEYITDDGMIISMEDPKKKFNETYEVERQHHNYTKAKDMLFNSVKACFKTDKEAQEYVETEFSKKKTNEFARRNRFFKKALLNDWTHFITITYDPAKHDEKSFESCLRKEFSLLTRRQGWKIMGVFERSNADRLHFHGLAFVPDLKYKIVTKSVYSFSDKARKDIHMHIDFEKKFGQNDFVELNGTSEELLHRIKYVAKYITKGDGNIYYSRGLKEYVLCDVDEEDVALDLDENGYAKILFDDFKCIWDGQYYGLANDKNNLSHLPKVI